MMSEFAGSVRHMPTVEFWMFAGFAGVLAVLAFVAMFRFLHRSRLIQDTPTSRIRSAHQGYVELEGSAESLPGEAIRSALTGTSCVWYHFKIEEHRRSSKGGGRWHTVSSGNSKGLFVLRDDTGECVIDPEGALVTPSVKHSWHGSSREWPFGTPMPTGRNLLGGRYRYTEHFILPADHLYALGQFRSEGGGHHLPDVQTEVRLLLNEWKRDQQALLQRFDRDQDGRIDQDEWEAVRRAAEAEVQRRAREQQQGPVNHILSKPPHGRRPFILSTLPQDELAVRYRRLAASALMGFLLAGVSATWLLSVRFVF